MYVPHSWIKVSLLVDIWARWISRYQVFYIFFRVPLALILFHHGIRNLPSVITLLAYFEWSFDASASTANGFFFYWCYDLQRHCR